MLTLVSKHVIPYKKNYGLYRCPCGNICVKSRSSVACGAAASNCGCLTSSLKSQNSHRRTHGKSRSYEHRVWTCMRSRCNNKNATDYHLYGGRGIRVCDRWSSFKLFLEDMGYCPKNCTLDRKDVDGPYCKENCRWATSDEQSNNKRTTVFVTFGGKTLSIAQWARHNGWGDWVIRDRISSGWSAEDAVSVPLKKQGCSQ